MRSLAAVVLVALVASAVAGPTFQYFSTLKTYAQALAACPTHAAPGQVGFLATILNAAEQAQINALSMSPTAYAWLGGTDAAVEGTWRWAAGGAAGVRFWNGAASGTCQYKHCNWRTGEPNSSGDEDGLCIYGGDRGWNDCSLTGTFPYVCKFVPQAELASEYKLFTTSVTYTDAANACAADIHPTLHSHGYIATITNAEENAKAVALFHDLTAYTWIRIDGGDNNAPEGVYKYEHGPLAGQTFSNGNACVLGKYCNWDTSEPNNAGAGEDGLTVQATSSVANRHGQFNDYGKALPTPYLCRYDPIVATLDPAVTAFCHQIQATCAGIAAECTNLHNGVGGPLADTCDAAAAACNDVFAECTTKAANCPLG